MGSLKTKLITILAAVALSSCATLYQKEGFFTNGYSESRLSEDTFIVTFRANEMTSPEKVKQWALQRAAKVAAKHSYRYFAVLKTEELRYPSIRLTIQCFHDKPADKDVYGLNL